MQTLRALTLLTLGNLLLGCLGTPFHAGLAMPNFTSERHRLIYQEIALTVRDPRILKALNDTPRHLFVPPELQPQAYKNYPLEIGYGQTISQPLIVALMTDALHIESDHKVLEIGTGSGYQAAVLSKLAKEVYSIEIVEELGKKTRALLDDLGFDNIHTRIGDGTLGWKEHAPYDSIIATAAPQNLPKVLLSQLKDGGRLVIPLGRHDQHLKVFVKNGVSFEEIDLGPVRFVPMTGEALRNRS